MAKYTLVHGIRIAKDFTPETFGRLTTLGPAFRVGRTSYQVCSCECGSLGVYRAVEMRRNNTSSCGCWHKKRASENAAHMSTKHGMTNTREYRSWQAMVCRCTNPNRKQFNSYGGRGICVCERWLNSFEVFFADMGERPDGCSLDRIDNSRGYEPGNCRWATDKEQANNTRRNRVLTFNGKTQTVVQWAEELGISQFTVYNRIKRNLPIELILKQGKIINVDASR